MRNWGGGVRGRDNKEGISGIGRKEERDKGREE